MMDAVSKQSALRTDRLLLLAVVGVAWGWIALLPFQLDDHTFLRALHLLREGPTATEQAPSHHGSYLFRPVQLGWMQLLMLDGAPCSPARFHAGSLVLHALCVFLLHGLLRCWFLRGAALSGALVFAVMPAGGEAIAWVAASCDLLSTAAALAAALLLARGVAPSNGAIAAAGALAALGLLSKESMLAALPLLMLLALRGQAWRSWRALARRTAWFCTPLLLAFLVRAWVMETFSFRYAGGRALDMSGDTIAALLHKLPDVFLALFAPWPPALETAEPPIFGLPKLAVAGLMLLLPLMGLLFSRQVWLALLATVALWPAPLFAAPTAAGEVFSRSLYMSEAVFAVCFAAAAAAVTQRWRRGWVVVLCALLCVLGCSVEALLRYQCAQFSARDRLASIHASVNAALDRGANREPVVALSVPDGLHSIPLIGSLIPLAYSLPVANTQQPVLAFDSKLALFDNEVLVRASANTGVTVLEFDHQGRLLRDLRLPRGGSDGVSRGPDAQGWFQFDADFAPRAAPEIVLVFSAGEEQSVSVDIETSAGHLKRHIVLPQSAVQRTARLLLDHEEFWMLAAQATRLRVRGAELLRAPEAATVSVAAVVLEPEAEQQWPVAQPIRVRVRGLPARFAQMLVHFEVHSGDGQWDEAMRAELPHAGLGHNTEYLEWTPSPADRVIGLMHVGLRPETLAQMCAEHLVPRGLRKLHMRLRVEAAAADGTILCRSPWRQFMLLF